MALLDLSQTTVALQRLLEFNIPRLEPALTDSLTISTLPPERTEGADHVLSLYCYHVSPDASNRYNPRQVGGGRPVATAPLTINLNYILTAHTFTGTDFNALTEQRLLGYAMKTLHDYPVIDDTTRIGPDIVLPDEIRGQNNRFSITQLQLTPGEALNYWANETQTTVKPSCYYEVSAAELQPDPPDRLPGTVFQIGSFVFPKSAPAIAETRAPVPFTLPPGAGGGAMSVTASPARVGPVAAAPPPDTNRLVLAGQGLAGGDDRRLLISHPFWASLFPGGTVPVDLVLNGALGWSAEIADDRVDLSVGDVVRAVPAAGPSVDLELYPGVYSVAWEVARAFEVEGATEWMRERSNAVPVLIYPRITGFTRSPDGEVTLDLGGAWLLTRGRPAPPDPTTAPELSIALSVDGRAYRLVSGPAPTGPGTFTIADHALTYAPNEEEDTPGDHSIRLVVDGADSQPFWVVVP